MYVVKITNMGHEWFLRSSTWTGDISRANVFETEEMAKAALDRVKKFTQPKLFRTAKITTHIPG